jgi:hypothetical protein
MKHRTHIGSVGYELTIAEPKWQDAKVQETMLAFAAQCLCRFSAASAAKAEFKYKETKDITWSRYGNEEFRTTIADGIAKAAAPLVTLVALTGEHFAKESELTTLRNELAELRAALLASKSRK